MDGSSEVLNNSTYRTRGLVGLTFLCFHSFCSVPYTMSIRSNGEVPTRPTSVQILPCYSEKSLTHFIHWVGGEVFISTPQIMCRAGRLAAAAAVPIDRVHKWCPRDREEEGRDRVTGFPPGLREREEANVTEWHFVSPEGPSPVRPPLGPSARRSSIHPSVNVIGVGNE